MDSIPAQYWKIILVVSILITMLSLISLPTLYENVSGDSVPNISQKGPPIEYQWDTAVSRILIAIIFLAVSLYSYNKVKRS